MTRTRLAEVGVNWRPSDQLTLEQLTNGPKSGGGGDSVSALARLQIAQREEQIVALRLRHHSFGAIARVVGVSKHAAQKAFFRALHRSTTIDIRTHHRTELAELDAEAKAAWEMGTSRTRRRSGPSASPV